MISTLLTTHHIITVIYCVIAIMTVAIYSIIYSTINNLCLG